MVSAADNKPLVTIGVAAYRRTDALKNALGTLCAQTYPNVEILVHQNPSDVEGIAEIVNAAVKADHRITYRRHEQNIGPFRNFESLLLAARGELFMWASDDDYWEPTFIESLVHLHCKNPRIGMAFSGVRAANVNNVEIGTYDYASRYTPLPTRHDFLEKFLREPEILGKANMFHGLYNTQALRSVWQQWYKPSKTLPWGIDVALIFAFTSRNNVAFAKPALMTKRTAKANNQRIWVPFPDDFGFPLSEYSQYRDTLLEAAPDADCRDMVLRIMHSRYKKTVLVSTWRRPISKLLRRINAS